MRRLIAFIVLTISMLGLVLFNVQGINENLSYSQEFANGTEVLYKISGAGNEETTIDIDNVVSVMGDRLEASGATNYSIQKASDGENNYEVKIFLEDFLNSELLPLIAQVDEWVRILPEDKDAASFDRHIEDYSHTLDIDD